jgi:hypothetical protein
MPYCIQEASMSPLAFDKQGKPFAWHRRTRKLLVRMFRNPAARGTCCQVLDAEGNPLYIDAETEYSEFRKAVGNVPGLYRLDQSDDDGVEIDDAQPAYVSIDLTRNASLTSDGDVDPLVIIEHMFAIHADVMKTMAMQQASIMAASAEILRAPLRPAAPAVACDPRDEADKDDKDDKDDDDDDELEPDPWASWRPMLEMVEPHLPKLGAFLLAQFVAFMKTATPPAATPVIPSPGPAPAPHSAATPIQSAEGTGAAAGSSPASSASVPSSISTPTPASSTAAAPPAGPPSARVDNAPTPGGAADAETNAPSHPIAPSTPAATSVASTQTAAATATTTSTSTSPPSLAGTALAIAPSAPTGSPRNAPPAPTPDQWEHLHEIRERLSPKERAIAENAIMRMDADLLTRYLADLSEQSVDDAVATIRSMIAKLPATRGRERG